MAGFSTSNQSGSSQAQSGLRGTPYEGAAATQGYQAGVNASNVASQMANPFNSQGQTQFQGVTGNQILPGGQYGMGSNADLAMNQLAKTMFGYTSADMGSRGMVSPENQAGVVGSAITNALPQVLPQIQNWQLAQAQAPLLAGQYAQGGQTAAGNLWSSLLGGSSQSGQSGSSYGGGVFQFGGSTK